MTVEVEIETGLESGCAEDVLGVFTGIQIPWSTDMKCPTCAENSTDSWHSVGEVSPAGLSFLHTYRVESMECANDKCKQLVIRITETKINLSGPDVGAYTQTWVVVPRFGSSARPLDPLVEDRWRRDYLEAAEILEASPRMSAVLSRRLLADLLEEYAGHAEYGLAARIESFRKDAKNPSALRENLHYLREIADLSAHTKKDDQAQVIEVSQVEAEWTLDLIDRLFDYFIVSPAKDAHIREAVDEKLKQAKRKPIPPLPDGKAKDS